MTRRKDSIVQPEDRDRHGTLSLAAYQRYENLKKFQRDLRLAERDATYRRALGLEVGTEMPKQLGTAGGTRNATYKGVRGSKRLA